MKWCKVIILWAALLLTLCLTAGAVEVPSIDASHAVLVVYGSGEVLYEKGADDSMVPASMTKFMTAYIIYEEIEAGRLTMETQIPISAQNAAISRNPAYPAMVSLPSGGTVDVQTLLQLILLPSASASCLVMAEYIAGSEEAFVARMNETARTLGMVANYENCHGAFPHYLTPRSQSFLAESFLERFPEVLSITSMPSMTFQGRSYANTNKLLDSIYYEGADGLKTGSIPEAGYCVTATAERDGQRLIAVVMNAGSNNQRFYDAATLLDYGFAQLAEQRLYVDIEGHWGAEMIGDLTERGMLSNTVEGRYRPDESLTRAEFVLMLVSLLESMGRLPAATEPVAFSDISGHWAEEALRKAVAGGLLQGYEDGLLRPDAVMTREEVMTFLFEGLAVPGDAGDLPYADSEEISDWALEAVSALTAALIVEGDDDGLLKPGEEMTRAEAAAILYRSLAYVS